MNAQSQLVPRTKESPSKKLVKPIRKFKLHTEYKFDPPVTALCHSSIWYGLRYEVFTKGRFLKVSDAEEKGRYQFDAEIPGNDVERTCFYVGEADAQNTKRSFPFSLIT